MNPRSTRIRNRAIRAAVSILGAVARLSVATGLALGIACSSTPRHSTGAAIGFPQLTDSLSLLQGSARVSAFLLSVLGETGDSLEARRFERALDSCAEALVSRCGPKPDQAAVADSILSLVYRQWGVRFDPRDSLAATLLPHRVFSNRAGACVGTGLVILLLAERLACPIHGVLLPDHFFCRFDDGTRRFNIEPNAGGLRHGDAYYRERYGLRDQPWYALRNLSRGEVLGVLCYNAGNICLNRGQTACAQQCYREAVRRLPQFPPARGNLAVSMTRQGDFNGAESLFVTLEQDFPSLPQLAHNRGSVALAAGRYQQAIALFRGGLDDNPRDTRLLNGLAEAYRALHRTDSASFFRAAAREAAEKNSGAGRR